MTYTQLSPYAKKHAHSTLGIIKRDGRTVPFYCEKIASAIQKAFRSRGIEKDPEYLDKLASKVDNLLSEQSVTQGLDYPTVEQVQDVVEQVLIDSGHIKTAKAYMLYRAERTRIRERGNRLMKTYEDITYKSAKDSDIKRENANINGDTAMGMMLKYGSEGAKHFCEAFVLNPEHSKAHREGDIHIHDMDFLTTGTTTCTQISVQELFKGGFSTGHGTLREPNDIQSYSALACIAIQSNQNDQHGGQSIVDFDRGLAPGVVKTFRRLYRQNLAKLLEMSRLTESSDNEVGNFGLILQTLQTELLSEGLVLRMGENEEYLKKEATVLQTLEFSRETIQRCQNFALRKAEEETDRATFQAMEALVHNLNSMHSRCGSQTPFSSINYGLDTTPEGRMVMKNVLLAHERGLGNGETPIFPIHIFRVKKGISHSPEDPNYDLFQLACRVSAKRLFPNFAFQDAPYNLRYYDPNDYKTEIGYMGCVNYYEYITYKIRDELFSEEIGRAYERLRDCHYLEQQKGVSSCLYTAGGTVKIYDTTVNAFVEVKHFIKNPDMGNWVRIDLSNGQSLTVTLDHPFPVKGKGRTFVKDMCVCDELPVANTLRSLESGVFEIQKDPAYVKVLGITYLGNLGEESFDVETVTDRFDLSGICSHNCRTRVIGNVFDPEREISPGRGNLSFTSINLPRLAIESKGDVEFFFQALEEKLALCVDQLLERFEIQAAKRVRNSPFLMGEGVWIDSEKLRPDDELREVLKHGTFAVGFIGLAETLISLTGKHHGESPASQALGLEIIRFMRRYLDAVSAEKKLNFTLLATPAEGLSGRFVKIDKKRYGVIEGVTDKEYYTNSFHVPVYHKISILDKINLEAPYHELTNAGHITYVEVDGDMTKNLPAFEKIIHAMGEAGIGFGAINHPIDRDTVCGYSGVIKDVCPECGREEGDIPFERIRRITGYLVGTLDRFNNAKRKEVQDRLLHSREENVGRDQG